MKITDKKKHRPQRDCKEKAWDGTITAELVDSDYNDHTETTSKRI